MYRATRSYENISKGLFDSVGAYGIPRLAPVECDTAEFIGFNFARSCKDATGKGVHFFVDDYQFARCWTHPETYLGMLSRFDCAFSPDFSTYTDFPAAIQIYNHYRKHWLGAYWQANGIKVIPTISWSGPESFEWCFDGEPVGGCVAVSSVGTQMNKHAAELFRRGYDEMLDRLQPSRIFFYGTVPDGCEGNIAPIKAFQERFRQAEKAQGVE